MFEPSDLLRLARTAALRVASPLDFAARSLTRKSHLPPLWLRRHAGPTDKFESAAREMAEFLDRIGLPGPEDDVLDVGCGPGAMAGELAKRIGPAARYVGFDVHAPSIRWCRRSFGSDPRLAFELARVASPYGSPSGEPAVSYRFPMEDARAGLVLAKSLFTHLLEPEARHYLAEIRRTLKSGGGAVVTAFLFDPQAPGCDLARRAFPFGDADGRVRWRLRARPAAAVAYARPLFLALIEQAGLRVESMFPGYFPGAEHVSGQDILVLRH